MYVNSGESDGLLRLHSTYRHDLKCYTSDEGRCQKTSAAFLKGLLYLEGALAPILAIMICKDKQSQLMLDDSSAAEPELEDIKVDLNNFLLHDCDDLTHRFISLFKEEPPKIMRETFEKIGNPISRMRRINELIACVVN
mmetsp:Transcript_4587/g.3088  ORF Transcript_4587/g.3088 Transcript_4587/m.3088 type:complete len:139 (+) Transcript_4587:2156-2572(+)